MKLYIILFSAVFGLFSLAGGNWLLMFNIMIFTKKAIVLNGKIVDFVDGGGVDFITYIPIIEYINPVDGQKERFRSNLGRSKKNKIGTDLKILVYKQKNGKYRCEEKNVMNLYVLPCILILMGFISLMIALINVINFS